MLERITQGEGQPGDIERLGQLAELIKSASLCALGGTAPNPVLTTIRYFREEYEEHIEKHYCRAGVCKQLVRSPCQNACPAGIDIPRYIRAIGQGKFGEAVAVIREKIPFPAVCGYVCVHYCEAKCRRGQLEEAVAIKELKRFAADHDTGGFYHIFPARTDTQHLDIFLPDICFDQPFGFGSGAPPHIPGGSQGNLVVFYPQIYRGVGFPPNDNMVKSCKFKLRSKPTAGTSRPDATGQHVFRIDI